MSDSIIYALDFDGVICDSAVETAITGWKAAAELWQDMPKAHPTRLIERFREVRPIIETGYEAILAMRLLFLGESVPAIYAGYADRVGGLLAEVGVDAEALKTLFGATRDRWIAEDRAGWIAMNPLFPGIAAKLRGLARGNVWYIVTTKQERFVKFILHAHGIELADDCIFGLDRRRGKAEILKTLVHRHPGRQIVFVEDRLPTLQSVSRHPELADVKLWFALWGYGIPADRHAAIQHAFTLQQLEGFLDWAEPGCQPATP